MRKIYKYTLTCYDGPGYMHGYINVPKNALVLHVNYQESLYGSGWMVWALVDPAEEHVVRSIDLLPTGADEPASGRYLNTIILPGVSGTVWHAFELS